MMRGIRRLWIHLGVALTVFAAVFLILHLIARSHPLSSLDPVKTVNAYAHALEDHNGRLAATYAIFQGMNRKQETVSLQQNVGYDPVTYFHVQGMRYLSPTRAVVAVTVIMGGHRQHINLAVNRYDKHWMIYFPKL